VRRLNACEYRESETCHEENPRPSGDLQHADYRHIYSRGTTTAGSELTNSHECVCSIAHSLEAGEQL